MKKLFVLSSLFVATSAMAGFQASSNQNAGGFVNTNQEKPITVAQALKAKDDSIVTLKGQISKQISDDDFIFTDGTGQIEVEIERKAWNGLTVSANEPITIQAKVDNEMFEKTKLDVFSVTK